MVSNIRAQWREFPVKQVTVLGVLLSIGSISGSTRLPFLPFLTHDFFPYLKSNQIGYYAGFLTSATYAGMFLGCFMWGKLSDIVGRRPILLSSATALLVGTLLVGLSFSFLWTVGVLFFEGFLNGTLVVAKTYLYEICPHKFHSFAFSVVWIPGSVAHFVCPMLGGFLACPATRFQTFDKPFFKQFPYILPCAVVACLEFCILIGGCIYLGESLNKKPKYDYISLKQISTKDVAEDDKEISNRQEESTISLLRDRLVLTSCALYALYALASISSSQLLPLLLVSDPQHGGYNCNAAEIALVLTTIAIYSGITQATLNPYIASKFTYKSVYVSGVVLHAVGIILLPSMVNITGAMSSQQVANETETSSDLTLNFAADSEHSLISPPARESRVQPTLQHISASSQYVVATAEMNATAARSLIGQCRLDGDSRKGASKRPASELQASVWGPLLLVILLMEQGSHQSALVAIVMVGNAGVQSTRGTVYGIAHTMAGLAQLVGPAASANLYAWTTDNGLPWPLDHHLPFYLVAVLSLLMAVLCASLPASINLPRAAPGKDSPTVSEGEDEGDPEDQGEGEEKISMHFRKRDSKTWVGGIDDKDGYETNPLLPPN